MNKEQILLAEDDPNLGAILKEYLVVKGYDCTLCINGEEAYNEFIKNPFDICVFDVMMPIKDGFSLAKDIRKINEQTPIIFLTAKSLKEDAIEGFIIGADDYITKPFSMEILLLRIKAILKRANSSENNSHQTVFDFRDYHFDYNERSLQQNNTLIAKLTSKENELLKLLCQKQNDVLDRTFTLKTIWEDDSYFNSRSMDVYVTKLRKYFKPDENIEIINVHGKGFKFLVRE